MMKKKLDLDRYIVYISMKPKDKIISEYPTRVRIVSEVPRKVAEDIMLHVSDYIEKKHSKYFFLEQVKKYFKFRLLLKLNTFWLDKIKKVRYAQNKNVYGERIFETAIYS